MADVAVESSAQDEMAGAQDEVADEVAGAQDEAARAQELDALRSMYAGELRELPGGELEVRVPISLHAPLEVVAGAARASVSHLSLALRARAPPGYPSSAAPEFAVIASWLDPCAHAHLLASLVAEWEQTRQCVLIAWVELLRADAAASLNERIALADCAGHDGAPIAGGVIVREPAYARRALAGIVAEDKRRVDEADGAAEQQCGVCLQTVLRLSCPVFAGCSHRFCRGCLRIDLEGRIRDGAASALGCPQCRLPLLPTEVASLVAPELFAAYEQRTLHSSLAGMDDVVFCPLAHCQSPVLLDRGAEGELEQLGRCAQCAFAFCILCQRSWHGSGPCSDFKAKWDAADADERAALEARFGDRVIADMQSIAMIASTTQSCPCCRASIEKAGGCNHMTCGKCQHQWCWLCRGRYTPTHFAGSGCRQFSDDFFAEVARALAEQGDGGGDGGVGSGIMLDGLGRLHQ